MATRKKPMKAIVAGMPRMGTISMTSALSGLGFTPYDYDTRLKKGHLPQWNRMLKEKSQGRKGSLDKDHLDRSTGDYDCISDAPCFFLVEELAQAYPEAKIILNEREATAWLASIEKTLQASFTADQTWFYRPYRWLDPTFARPIMICNELTAAVLCDSDYLNKSKLQQRYAEHYRSLSQLGEHRTLKYRVQEGWKPLCDFLDLPVPDRAFPRHNDANHLNQLSKQSASKALRNIVRNLFGGALLFMMTAMVLARYSRL